MLELCFFFLLVFAFLFYAKISFRVSLSSRKKKEIVFVAVATKLPAKKNTFLFKLTAKILHKSIPSNF